MTRRPSAVREDARREGRISSEDDNLLVEAAGLAGVSVSEFLLDRALADAERIVADHHVVELQVADYERFMAALDDPAPNTVFIAAMRRAQPFKPVD
jgi:uncharacterized protein (DUF1778 family)